MHNREIDNNNINTLDIANNQAIHNNETNIEMHPSIFDCNLDDFRRTCTSLFHRDPSVLIKFQQVINNFFCFLY